MSKKPAPFEDDRKLHRLISEVSQHSGIKVPICDVVVRATIDVLGADIAKNGETRLPYIMTVKTFDHAGTTSSLGKAIEPGKRLSARISPTLRKLFKRVQEENLPITPQNWRTYLYENDKPQQKNAKTPEMKPVIQRPGNPFLYD